MTAARFDWRKRVGCVARADAMIAEVECRRLPPNQTVRAMFTEARARFGSRDLEERSITSWIRKHSPAVAALWPEAPLDASWFAWRCHVVREHLDVLDSAFEAVTGCAIKPTNGGEHE